MEEEKDGGLRNRLTMKWEFIGKVMVSIPGRSWDFDRSLPGEIGIEPRELFECDQQELGT